MSFYEHTNEVFIVMTSPLPLLSPLTTTFQNLRIVCDFAEILTKNNVFVVMTTKTKFVCLYKLTDRISSNLDKIVWVLRF